MKQKEKPQYQSLKFDSEFEFMQWLQRTTRYILHLEDHGQELHFIYIDEGGEILHVKDAKYANLYRGKIVDLDSMQAGSRPVYDNHMIIKYPIAKVENWRPQ